MAAAPLMPSFSSKRLWIVGSQAWAVHTAKRVPSANSTPTSVWNPNGAAEQLQRHHAQELAFLRTVVAADRQRLAPRLNRGETLRLDHATAQECQQKRRNDAGEKDVAPPVGADPI